MSVHAWHVEPLVDDAPGVLLEATASAFEAMADDGVPRLRWYRPTSVAVVRGRGQARLALPGATVPILDRSSGGGAVLLSPDLLSCDVLVPADHPLAGTDPMATFDGVGAAWRAALGDLGVDGLTQHHGPSTAVHRGDARQRLLAAVCFATRARGEVLADGRKLVGLAQRRRRPGVLVQCGLLRRWRPAELLSALGAEPDDPEIAEAAVGLEDLMAPAPDDAAVTAAVSAHLAGWTRGDERRSDRAARDVR